MSHAKLGEADGGIKPRRPLLAHRLITRISLHVGTKITRARSAMARVAGENGFLLRAIAVGACTIVVAVVSWSLVHLMSTASSNSNRLTAIEITLDLMQRDIERMANE